MIGGGDSSFLKDSWAVKNDAVTARGLLEEMESEGGDQDVADRWGWVDEEFFPDVFALGAAV